MPTDPHDPQEQTARYWGWLQRPWWFCCALIRALSPARFSLFVAIIGGALFLYVQQGTEILRSLAERDQDKETLNLTHIVWFFGSLLLWSMQSWYWARRLLNVRFPGVPPLPGGWQGDVIHWCQRQGPRILGVLPPLLLAAACFFVAPHGYADDTSHGNPKAVLRLFGVIALGMALILYAGFFLHRRRLERSGRVEVPRQAPIDGSEQPARNLFFGRGDGGTWWTALSFALFAVVLTFNFLFRPVQSGLTIGSGAILCLAAAAWVCFGSLTVWLSDRLRLPLIGLLVAWAVFCSLWNDNHLIRMIPLQTLPAAGASEANASPQLPVAQAFTDWQATLPKAAFAMPAGQSRPLRPVYVVATEGGGIRAAYWTALVLASLQDLSQENSRKWQADHPGRLEPPDFASHLFAVSGVSGGSLGAAVFDALLAEHSGYPLAPKARYMLRQDFLSPTLAALLFPDLLQRFWPWPVAAADRARALEKGWENGWANAVSGHAENRFADPFLSLWNRPDATGAAGPSHLPSLFLNGTSVETGKRIITSNVRIVSTGAVPEFSDADDAEQEVAVLAPAPRDVPVSTAAHMSARFTYVSPAGRLPSGGHIVDGGYFENSGATTALEILYAMEGAIDAHPQWPERLVPVVIEIRNGPVGEPPGGGEKPAPPPKLVQHHDLLGEVFDPLATLLNTRDARGSFSQASIEAEQNEPNNPPPWPMLYRFGLYESKVPLPLGWMLSGGASREMNRQLHAKDLGNQKTLDDITRLLLPPAP